jgi:hypothetical protein
MENNRDMTEGPRAIETVYNGYRFRSRLEARWAVFLDNLGVTYEYEGEGYSLADGVYYLPDFYLPQLTCWMEVKGHPIARMDETWRKAYLLAQQAGEHVVVFSGQIGAPGQVFGLDFMGTEDDETGHSPDRVFWFQCPMCNLWQLGRHIAELPCGCLWYSPAEQPAFVAAINTAKQARFEFGQTPKGPRER